MKGNSSLSLLILVVSAILVQSCDNNESTLKGIYSDGVFITNEGAFGQGNGSVSFYSVEGDSVVNNIFEKANTRTLGDVVQFLTVFNEKAYICVNASNKIEIARSSDFTELGVIEDLPSVRHFIGSAADKAYATVWGDGGQVKVLDLITNTVTKSIDVGNGPEMMAIVSNKLYVANSGGFTEDNTISVISTDNDELLKTITLDADNPVDLVDNKAGMLWVLCMGKAIYDTNWTVIDHTPAKLIKINTVTDEIETSIVLFEDAHPNKLEMSPDGFSLYYGAGFGFNGIYKISTGSLSVPSIPFISGYFYGFNVYKNGEIFATKSPSFTDNGLLYRYGFNGTYINEYTVGIGPNSSAYKRGLKN